MAVSEFTADPFAARPPWRGPLHRAAVARLDAVLASEWELPMDDWLAAAEGPWGDLAWPAVLLERLAADPTPRPLMEAPDPAGRLADLLEQRRPLYAQADLHIQQDGRPPAQVAAQILEALPSVLKQREAPPEHRLEVENEAGERGRSIN